MSLVCFSRWLDWGRIIFLLVLFPAQKAALCLPGGDLRPYGVWKVCGHVLLVPLWDEEVPRYKGREKEICVSSHNLYLFIALFTWAKDTYSYHLVITFPVSWVCSLMVNFSNAFRQGLIQTFLCLALLFLMAGERCVGFMSLRLEVCTVTVVPLCLWPALWHRKCGCGHILRCAP